MSHEQTRNHKTHHGLDLGEATTFPLIVFYVPGHRANTQMSFYLGTPSQVRVPKFMKFTLPQLWTPITSFANLQSRWGLKQNCSPHQDLFNDMWHATWKQENQGDSWLFVVESQTTNLTLGPSFGHNVLKTQMGHASSF